MVAESNNNHAWSFSPVVSLLISDNSENLTQTLFKKLSINGGQVMIPIDNYEGDGDYGFGKKFGWCQDKYGISWQFILTE